MPGLIPAVFFGHGNPMNAVGRNRFTRAWAALGASIERPKAVLMISAHWYVPGIKVTAMDRPRTLHDFHGFPRELYAFDYPAPGKPDLARRIGDLLAPVRIAQDHLWGLDHGAWSVLTHVFPHARIPVVQMSLDETLPPEIHCGIARRLAPLRDEGVLIAASGNVVHNLALYSWTNPAAEVHDWAARFDQRVRELALAGDTAALADYPSLGPDANLAVPTPEHYLPLIYVLAQRRDGEAVTFPVEGFDGSSISMLSVRVG